MVRDSDEVTGVARRRRATVVRGILLLLLLVLLGAFFRLQVLRSSRYALRSEANRLRAITLPSPRGTIYDRDGQIVAENVPGYSIGLLPGRRDSVRVALAELAPLLGIDSAEHRRLLERHGRNPGTPLILRDQAAFEQVSAVEARRPRFRRAVVEMRPRRHYPAEGVAAHLIGYVGEIGEAELADTAFAGYEQGRIVGKAGLERQYEDRLAGEPGVRYVEVSALGSIVREFGPRPAVQPVPGEDLTLGLDLSLQSYVDSIFPEDHRGSVVALDPRNGEVVVFYSHPTYDPNAFVGGIDPETWSSLRDDPDRPLLNRVTAASYPPGSTWKLLVAADAMRRDQVGLQERMPIPCRGALRYGNRRFRCWRPEGHGPLALVDAIQRSCNVFFYQLGLRVGLDAMIAAAERWGYNEPTGIDLPHEITGHFPTSREWFDRRYGPRGWTESVVLNLAIGQGENAQTLLRQALFYAALATGEAPIVPHLVRDEELERRRADWDLELSEEHRRELLRAMTQVVNEPGGTAYPYRLERWRLAGKTGTAQNPHGEPHSWFVGFAPAEDPRIVVATMVEHGHPDQQTSLAVPLAASVVRRHLGGPPPDTVGSAAPSDTAPVDAASSDAAPSDTVSDDTTAPDTAPPAPADTPPDTLGGAR